MEALVDSTVEHARKEFNVPGISVAVVKDGKVVLAKGYGVRRMGSPEPMSERTLVGIGSNTKAFTAAALAMLVDEKKLSWDDRVIDRLPEFALSGARRQHRLLGQEPFDSRTNNVKVVFTGGVLF